MIFKSIGSFDVEHHQMTKLNRVKWPSDTMTMLKKEETSVIHKTVC